MAENEKILHLGADFEAKLVLEFREQAKQRKFKLKEIIRSFAEWWIKQDLLTQQNFYHHTAQLKPSRDIKAKPDLKESIDNVKYFVKFKLPSPEDQKALDELRRALGSEIAKQKKKAKRG